MAAFRPSLAVLLLVIAFAGGAHSKALTDAVARDGDMTSEADATTSRKLLSGWGGGGNHQFAATGGTLNAQVGRNSIKNNKGGVATQNNNQVGTGGVTQQTAGNSWQDANTGVNNNQVGNIRTAGRKLLSLKGGWNGNNLQAALTGGTLNAQGGFNHIGNNKNKGVASQNNNQVGTGGVTQQTAGNSWQDANTGVNNNQVGNIKTGRKLLGKKGGWGSNRQFAITGGSLNLQGGVNSAKKNQGGTLSQNNNQVGTGGITQQTGGSSGQIANTGVKNNQVGNIDG